jgi:hypothetical protein
MVSSINGSSLPDQLSLKTPALCVEHLKMLFAKIAVSLSDFQTMQQYDSYFLFRRGRCKEMESLLKSSESSHTDCQVWKERIPSAPPLSTKPCAGYMGGLLGATNKNGRPYKCDWGGKSSYNSGGSDCDAEGGQSRACATS